MCARRLAEKESPLAHRQVQTLWHETSQPAWSKTPFKLLQGAADLKGWQLTVQSEAGSKLTASHTSLATLHIPGNPGDTICGRGRCTGALPLRPEVPRPPAPCAVRPVWTPVDTQRC